MTDLEKKVLYIAHAHPAFSRGGGELAAYYLYQAMKLHGHYRPFLLARFADPSCQVQHPGSRLLGWEKDAATQLLVSNSSNYDYFYHTKLDAKLAEADMYADVREFLLALKPDVVHFQHFMHMGVDLISYVKKLLPEARVLLTLHEYGAICAHDGSMLKTDRRQLCRRASTLDCCRCFPRRKPREFFLRERLIKSNFSAVDLFHAPSEFLKERYVEWGVAPERIVVMDHGRPAWAATKRSAGPAAGQPFRVAFFGQMVFHKGWDVFLQAAGEYARLRSQTAPGGHDLPELHFSLHGNRHLPEELCGRLDALLEATRSVVHDHGPYEMDGMQDLLSRVDCVVVPSIWWENSPLVIQEAFMAGLPVICSNIGGMAEKVQDRVNGLHFAVGDHFDLLDRILELAGSAELYRRLVQGIPEILPDREMAQRFNSIYDGLLQGAQPAQPRHGAQGRRPDPTRSLAAVE